MSEQNFVEKTGSREEIFHGKIIDVAVDQVQLPDGTLAKRELVFHPGAVAIIPIVNNDEILLVKQYRKPLEKTILEIPAGKLEVGEHDEPKKAALRELEEETGFSANHLDYVTSMYTSPGFADEIIHIYFANQLTKVLHPLPQDEDEHIALYRMSLADAQAAVKTGLICDAKSIFAVQYWELLQLRKQCKGE